MRWRTAAMAALLATGSFAGFPALAAVTTVKLDVQNMTCEACPITVKKALTRVRGVKKADVSYEKKQAVVTYDDAATTPQKLMAATRDAGYPSSVSAGK